MFDRPGNYRFHFKSVDPEYGMVKEEVRVDDQLDDVTDFNET